MKLKKKSKGNQQWRDEAKNQINDLEQKEDSIQSEQQEEKRVEKTRID